MFIDDKVSTALLDRFIHHCQIEGTQATIIDLFDDEAGLEVNNTDDVEEVTNYIAAYRNDRQQEESEFQL